MSKAVSLYLPHFATDLVGRRCRARLRAKRRPDRRGPAILLQATNAGRQVVAACCAQAAAAGVRVEMTMAEARALLAGEVIVEPHDPDRDLQALEALGRWALRFSPLVAVDPPDGLLIDIAGCAHLFGGEGGLVDRIAEGAGGLGLAARVAAAPTLACARALARFAASDRLVVPGGGERDTLEPLPVAALDVGSEVVEALAEVGVDRIGQLLALRRDEVAKRFGMGLLKRLDQALGRMPEAIETIRDEGPPQVECVFAGPVKQLEAIQLTVNRLLKELAVTLERRECGIRKLELHLDRADAGPCRETLALSRPSRDAKHLRTLLAPRVESMNMAHGVERVSLVVTRTGRLPH
ncbi:MAG: Y-family DNA polymerase, partial [Planctomycetota bacterium]